MRLKVSKAVCLLGHDTVFSLTSGEDENMFFGKFGMPTRLHNVTTRDAIIIYLLIGLGIVTRLRAGRSGVRPDRLWGPHSLLFNACRGSCPSGRWVMLTTYLHLAPRLRMSRAIPPLPLYAFMPWTGIAFIYFTTLPLAQFTKRGMID